MVGVETLGLSPRNNGAAINRGGRWSGSCGARDTVFIWELSAEPMLGIQVESLARQWLHTSGLYVRSSD